MHIILYGMILGVPAGSGLPAIVWIVDGTIVCVAYVVSAIEGGHTLRNMAILCLIDAMIVGEMTQIFPELERSACIVRFITHTAGFSSMLNSGYQQTDVRF